ncbi:TPA: hypothetical protein ACNBA3_002938 [Legionella pneumophila]|nr:hypothetical protein [Legionella pneumophila]HBD7173645.1 hypothetical protein [Legionella pneumophila]HCU5989929.1 hypothetical protein [Legionella pneumophila]HDP7979098.1 hypothetical protein [Legionella pneumophila]HEM6948541.1 hypothetical protein [Legionella pneumophila]
MTKDEVREIANRSFGLVLRSGRLRIDKEFQSIADDLGMNEAELRRMETFPAEVPCCDLYRLISYYGPASLREADLAWIELSFRGRS